MVIDKEAEIRNFRPPTPTEGLYVNAERFPEIMKNDIEGPMDGTAYRFHKTR